MRFRFNAPLWEWGAQGGWFFVTLPEGASDDIREVLEVTKLNQVLKVHMVDVGSA